jgi:hypothetical protein
VEPRKKIGRYEVRECVGRGGMGALFRGHDPVLDREVAIKTMLVDFLRDEDGRARFYREARAVARLQHRNIVTLFDFGEDEGTPYIVMEFLVGQTVADCVRSGLHMPIERVLDIGAQLCTGLHFAHVRGIVHRDVKPPNIWLNDDGGVKVLDFGIAKFGDTTVTRIGGVVGSLSYMSPEQVGGSDDVDGRSDIFSVGIVLYELLSGKRPFRGDSPTAIMMKIVNERTPPLDVPGVPPQLAALIERALEKDRGQRFQQASELASELRTLQHTVSGSHGRSLASTRPVEIAPISSRAAEETRERAVAVATPPPAGFARPVGDAAFARDAAPADDAVHDEQDVIRQWSLGSSEDVLGDALIGGQASVPAASADAAGEASPGTARSAEWIMRWPTLAVAGGVLAIAAFALVLMMRAEPSGGAHKAADPATAAGTSSSAAGNAVAGAGKGAVKGAVMNGTAASGATTGGDPNTAANAGASASGNTGATKGDPAAAGAGGATGSESTDVHVVLTGGYAFSVVDDGGRSLSGPYTKHELRVAPKQVLRLQARQVYLDQRVTVDGKPGSTMRLQAPALGWLAVRTARETCPVLLNNVSLGYPPIAPVRVASGKYRLTQACSDGDSQTSIVTIPPGATEVALIH